MQTWAASFLGVGIPHGSSTPLLGVRASVLIPQQRLCRCRRCNYAIDPRRLPEISSICEEIELNIVERSKGVVEEPIMVAIEDYIEWQDYLPSLSLRLLASYWQ